MPPMRRFPALYPVLALVLLLPAVIPGSPLVAPAGAAYWEDEFEGNAPEDRRRGPEEGFFLFRWIGSIFGDADEREIKSLEDRDRGPTVNSGRRTFLVVTSGLVGLGVGLLAAETLVEDADGGDRFVGGAVGFAAGVGIGAWIMPKDYSVDPVAALEGRRFARAWIEDPQHRVVRDAFHGAPVRVHFRF